MHAYARREDGLGLGLGLGLEGVWETPGQIYVRLTESR